MRKTIDDLFAEYLLECEFSRKLQPETLRGYMQGFSMFRKLMPAATLETMTNATIVQFFKILEQRKRTIGKNKVGSGVKKSTARVYWSKLYNFFTWLHQHEYITENPFRYMKRPTVVWDDLKYLKKEKIEQIFSALHNPLLTNPLVVKRNLAMFYILLFCGLRREELILLQLRDIDIERKILTVRAETSKIPRTRHIPLHSTVVMYLKDYIRERKVYTTPYVFVSRIRDEGLTMHGLTAILHSVKKRSGVQFHLHQFRHTFAVNFLKSSNNIVKLKQLLGHSDIRMTLVYLRCLPTNEMRADVEHMRIDDFV
ncbi:MAG: tyrosine-type recombinase/integrase [Candidatus Pacearchaeota archaeon]